MEQKRTKSIVLGITGGIAAYKAAELARLLVKQGITVQAAMTEAACRFITPVTLQALTGRPVLTNAWPEEGDGMAHISAGRAADAIVIAPASADFIAKLAHGVADDLLSTLCLARDCPLLVAPAMNRQMWANAATRRNVAQLESDNITLLGPVSGEQACGEEGMGRMLEADALAREIAAFLDARAALPRPSQGGAGGQSTGEMAGLKVLITAGPTYEAIDPVRGLTNRSSGKMGYAVAQAAAEMGAEVTLVSGPVALVPPASVRRVDVTSADEMMKAVQARAADADIFVGVAAVADYRAARPSEQKMKRSNEALTIELTPNADILAWVAGLPRPPFCIGFAAESERLHENATVKRRAKKIPLLAANLAQEAIGSDVSELVLYDDAGAHALPHTDKLTLARLLLQHALRLRSEQTA